MWAGVMGNWIALYRGYVTQREFQPTEKHKADFDRFAREARVKWRDWQGEDSLHEMAFGEPFNWHENPGSPLFSAPFAEIKCPCCDQLIPPTQHYLAYPTIRCWNCCHTFPAPESWRDWKPEPGFIARMEEKAAQFWEQCPNRIRQSRDRGAISTPGQILNDNSNPQIPNGRGRITRILMKQISALDGAALFAILFVLASLVSVFIWNAVHR